MIICVSALFLKTKINKSLKLHVNLTKNDLMLVFHVRLLLLLLQGCNFHSISERVSGFSALPWGGYCFIMPIIFPSLISCMCSGLASGVSDMALLTPVNLLIFLSFHHTDTDIFNFSFLQSQLGHLLFWIIISQSLSRSNPTPENTAG